MPPQPPPSRDLKKPPPPGFGGQTSKAFDNLGLNSTAQQRGGTGRGRPNGIAYPNFFRTLSQKDLPDDLAEIFAACKYLSKWSPVHKAIISAHSSFPITDIVIKPVSRASDARREDTAQDERYAGRGGDDMVTKRIQRLMDRHWRMKKFNQEASRSFYTYSNALVGISFPFQKMLRCTHCGHTEAAEESQWKLRDGGKFDWTCPKCGTHGRADVWDHWLDIPEDVRPILFDIERVDSLKNEFRGTVEYYYRLSPHLVKRLKAQGDKFDKSLVCKTPQAYLEAALGRRFRYFDDDQPRVKLISEQVFHLRAASLPEEDDTGLAFPEMAASLQDYWLLQLFRRAQEVVSTEFILPIRTMFPQPSGTSGNLFEMINVGSYMNVMREQYEAFRKDPGSVMFLPFPVGQQTLGGEAKALMLSQEMRVVMETIVASCGSVLEFVFGGLSYSGSNVSIKQQESRIEDHRNDLLEMNRWFYEVVSIHMRLPEVHLEHAPFRMGDDLQQLQMLAALKGQNLASSDRVYAELGWDPRTERNAIMDDTRFEIQMQQLKMKTEAEVQQQMMLRQMDAQAEGQVSGMESMITARLELQKKLRSDPELMGLVLKDPGLSMQIFGANSKEVQGLVGAGVVPSTPDPEEVAPKGKEKKPPVTLQLMQDGKPKEEHTLSADNARAAMDMELQRNGDLVPRLVGGFRDVPREQWGAILSHISDHFGSQVAQKVGAQLHGASAMADQMPEHLPARREI